MKNNYLKAIFIVFASVMSLNICPAQVTTDWYQICRGPWNNGFESEQIAVDDSGNVYMTGTTVTPYTGVMTSRLDIATAKYGPAGNLIWQKTYFNSGYSNEDYAKSLTLDKFSNVYVTGNIHDTTNNTSAFVTLKYNSSGDLLWASKQTNGNYYYPYRKGLLLDSSLNVYVFCRDYQNSYLIKYNSSGDSLWKYKTADYIYGSYLDSDYNIIIGSEHKFRKVSNAGNLIWEKTFIDTLWDVSITGDNAGNYYACGEKNDTVIFQKLSNSGETQWTKKYQKYELEGYYYFNTQRCLISKDGNILIASQSGSGFTGELFVRKITPGGSLIWEVKYAVSDSSWQILHELKEDSRGFIYAYALSEKREYPGNPKDYFAILKIDPNGRLVRVSRYGDLPTYRGEPKTFAIDKNFKIYVGLTDQLNESNFYPGTILARLSQPYDTLFIPEIVPVGYELLQNYPNPFNITTNFKFRLTKYTHVKLSVYDVLGRKVADLIDENVQADWHTYTWDASGFSSGLYFYKFETPEFSAVRKMVLLK